MAGTNDPERQTVMVVDDDEHARFTVSALLAREDYEIVFAANGHECLSSVQAVDPDVILLDVMMPDIDGHEVCRALKGDSALRHIPVILLTALGGRQDLVHGLEAGADEFLSKPVSGVELRARVRSMLRIKKQHDELKGLLTMREDLSRMIIHDLRSPLTLIRGYTDILLLQGPLQPEQREDLCCIKSETETLASMIQELLVTARMEHGQLSLDLRPTSLSSVLTDAAAQARRLARAANVEVRLELDGDRDLELEAGMFLRVADNLLSNAIRYSPENSTVLLRTRNHPGSVRIEVADEGAGVPPEFRAKIFEKFEIVPLRQAGLVQTGLGLYFCKMVVEAHGGSIGVEENNPQGSLFFIEMPDRKQKAGG